MKKVLLASVLLKDEQRPQTMAFETFEAFCTYRNCHELIQFTIQEISFYGNPV